MSENMKWTGGAQGGVGIPDQNVLAEAPAVADLLPVYDASAAAGKAIAAGYLKRSAEIDGSTDITLTAAQMGDTIIHNYGMTDADHYVQLPTCGPGMRCRLMVTTARAKKWGVKAGASDKIYLIAADGTVSAGADNGYVRFANAVLAQCLDVWSFYSGSGTWDWMAKAVCIATSSVAAN